MTRSHSARLVVLLIFAFLLGCSKAEAPQTINLENREPLPQAAKALPGNPIRFAVGGMITPREGFVYYKEFCDYVGSKVGRPVVFVEKEKYAEVNDLLRTGGVDVAFVCSGPYVDGHDAFGLELLAAPQAYGKTVYYSYIIVPKDSPVTRFAQLRGKRFAFADPLSNTGALVPEYMLARMGETPASFFKHYEYTYAHDRSIKAVAEHLVDGAAVDSLIWEYLNRTNPAYTSRTRIIQRSPPYGIPPVVVRKGLAPALKQALRRAFLHAQDDPAGRELLQKMMIDRFVPIKDSAYDTVREMKRWTARQRRRGR